MDPTPRIVLFGDSLTEWGFNEDTKGYGWALQQYYGEEVQILNRGFAGYNTTKIRSFFEEIIGSAARPGAAPILLFTIFLGANDAFLPPLSAHVPLQQFETNIRAFVEDIRTEQALENTKVVLITPPPINVRQSLPNFLEFGAQESHDEALEQKQSMPYRTYLNKGLYAQKIMQIAASYEEEGYDVVGLDFWTALVNSALEDEGRSGDEDRYDENRLPGSGLPKAREFEEGYFEDGLHLKHRAYEVLTKTLQATLFRKWPELEVSKIKASSV